MVVTPSADGESYDVDWKPSRWLPLAITMMMLMGINIGWPLFNLLPVPPLDGGMVLKEFFDWNLYGNRPPWEQDPNWWKRR
jgi:membrane-associated protease RseP (regulator of RpoE activity)